LPHYPDIRDLQLLIALSQRKHFAQAASDCGISQPAFSARIRNLEKELGIPVVLRGNKFLGFTRDGEMVLRWARKILADAEGLRQDVEIVKDTLQGVLVIGVVPTALSFAATVSARLRKTYPNLAIQIRSLSSAAIIRGLSDFSIDAGITYQNEKELGHLCFEALYDEHYVLLCPLQLAPRENGTASWKEAAGLPLCLLSNEMRYRKIIDTVFGEIGVDPQPVMETNAFTAALAQVASGVAATIAPQKLVDSFVVSNDLVRLQLTDPVVHSVIGLATTGQEPVLPAIKALKEEVKLAS
jgi:DNA-binding transcriptional LysR family regulator